LEKNGTVDFIIVIIIFKPAYGNSFRLSKRRSG